MGVSANHPNTQTYDIWLPQLLKNTKNRKVSLNEKGKLKVSLKLEYLFKILVQIHRPLEIKSL